jgi:hypothetical protein
MLMVLAHAVSPVSAQTGTPISDALQHELETIQTTVSGIRGLESNADVPIFFPSCNEIASLYSSGAYVSLEQSQFYYAFDFLDESVDLGAVYNAFSAEPVANGFYDSYFDEIHVIFAECDTLGDSLPATENVIYAHEYVHALQDMHFDIYSMRGGQPNNTDADMALTALLEGDAVFTEQLYREMTFRKGSGMDTLSIPDAIGDRRFPTTTPAFISAELHMPYFDGLAFVKALHDIGGYEQVNAAYASPPVSTEQIIHPERYLAGDRPQYVSLHNVYDAMGAGWELLFEDTFGEFYLREHLATQLRPSVVARAAEGWGGDQFAIYYNYASEQAAWVMRLAWDTPEDDAEFASIYAEFATARIGLAGAAQSNGATCWSAGADPDVPSGAAVEAEAICLLDDAQGTVIAYAPTLNDALTLINSQN